MEKETAKIVYNKEITKDIFEMSLYAPITAKQAKCGQFINVGLNSESKLLKRPISISQIDGDHVILCYKINGFGTKELSLYQENTNITIIGPLGNGFEIVNDKKILVVGGGIGVAPLRELVKSLKGNITILLAFRNQENVIYEKEFKEYGNVIITTDDGSYGYKGNAINYLNEFDIDFDCLYACGPEVLLSLLEKKYEGRLGYLSYEARMACGVGLCHGCVKGSDHYCVCTDGPVFKLGVIK